MPPVMPDHVGRLIIASFALGLGLGVLLATRWFSP